mmetsp:Transcript_5166/g.11256  ORF Transcript_5166/g.11256 Transcript_5166/m.11256 type:complete len:110 (-) Transcript_5166:185-514(-)
MRAVIMRRRTDMASHSQRRYRPHKLRVSSHANYVSPLRSDLGSKQRAPPPSLPPRRRGTKKKERERQDNGSEGKVGIERTEEGARERGVCVETERGQERGQESEGEKEH